MNFEDDLQSLNIEVNTNKSILSYNENDKDNQENHNTIDLKEVKFRIEDIKKARKDNELNLFDQNFKLKTYNQFNYMQIENLKENNTEHEVLSLKRWKSNFLNFDNCSSYPECENEKLQNFHFKSITSRFDSINVKKRKFNSQNFSTSNNLPDFLNNEEAKSYINILLDKIEELEYEIKYFQDNAMERIIEKEIENIELKSKLEELNQDLQSTFENINSDFKSPKIQKNIVKPNVNYNYEKDFKENITLQFQEYEKQLSDLKLELDYRNNEKEKLLVHCEHLDSYYRKLILSYENDLIIKKMEINRLETEKLDSQKLITNDQNSRDIIYQSFQEFQLKIKLLEENKEYTIEKYDFIVANLNSQIEELVETNKNLSYSLEKKNEEFDNYRNQNNNNKINLITDNRSFQVNNYVSQIEKITKENLLTKSELDRIKKSNDKYKYEFLETQEILKITIDNYENQIKALEDKYLALEKRLEVEKNDLIENNSKLYSKLNKSTNNITNSYGDPLRLKKMTEESDKFGTLEDLINEEENTNLNLIDENSEVGMLQIKIASLESQLTIFKNLIVDLKIKVGNLQTKVNFLEKENSNIKEDYLNSVRYFESQFLSMNINTNRFFINKINLRNESKQFIEDTFKNKQNEILKDVKTALVPKKKKLNSKSKSQTVDSL